MWISAGVTVRQGLVSALGGETLPVVLRHLGDSSGALNRRGVVHLAGDLAEVLVPQLKSIARNVALRQGALPCDRILNAYLTRLHRSHCDFSVAAPSHRSIVDVRGPHHDELIIDNDHLGVHVDREPLTSERRAQLWSCLRRDLLLCTRYLLLPWEEELQVVVGMLVRAIFLQKFLADFCVHKSHALVLPVQDFLARH